MTWVSKVFYVTSLSETLYEANRAFHKVLSTDEVYYSDGLFTFTPEYQARLCQRYAQYCGEFGWSRTGLDYRDRVRMLVLK